MPQTFWLPIYEGKAPAAASAVFTFSSAAYGRMAIRTVDMSNDAYTSATVWVWKLPAGGSFPANAVPIVPGWVLKAKDARGVPTTQWTGFRVLTADGDKLYVQSSTGTVDIAISGGFAK